MEGKVKKIVILSSTVLLCISTFTLSTLISNRKIESSINTTENIKTLKSPAELTSNGEKSVYLSDLEYITTNNWSYNGWANHYIQYDKNQEEGQLSLVVDGKRTYFTKGISIHAKGQVTYDISELSTRYSRFIAYIGVDGARGSNGDLWIQILVSKDGKTWEEKLKTSRMSGTTPAVDVDVNIEGYKYLRIYIDPNGSNAADHATIAKARLVTSDFDKNAAYYSKIHPVQYYDDLLKNNSVEENYNNNYKLVLEREVVNKIGYSSLQDLAEFTEGMEETLDWYFSSNERLEQIIEVGEVSNPTKFMQILNDLYHEFKEDFNSENGFVYVKMAVGLGAAYTTDTILSPLRFGGLAANYNYVDRFTVIKKLYDEDLFMRISGNAKSGNFVQQDWFKDYHVQLIRMIMNDGMTNDEFLWLNGYTHYRKTLNEGIVPYLSPNYAQAKLYSEANRELYTNKYLLNQYNIPYGDSTQRFWMVIEAGGICWNQSRFAQSMYRANGIPAIGAYQPGHEMYFNYYQDDNGNGYWSERYGNYNGAGTTWGGGQRYRLIFNWGAKSFTDQNIGGSKGGTSLGYLYLAQANLNNYDKYKKSLYYNLIANSYEDNNKKIETYFNALEVNDINLDSYDYIINLYKKMSVKNEGGTITSDDWYDLALKVTESYQYYPVTMYDLLKVIRPYLEGEKKLDIDRIEKEKLTIATTVSNETLASIGAVNAGSGVRTHAKRLLGQTQPDPISFSFDGSDGGKIVKNSIYNFHWAYSLDGGNTFTNFTEEDSIALTTEEIESITSQNDIIVKFMGLNDYLFTVDITDGSIPADLFGSDLENKIVGTTTALEWRFSDDDQWVSLSEKEPDLTGDKTVQVRVGYTGKKLPSNSITFTFTTDSQSEKRKYISVSHLSLENVSSQATNNNGSASFALDANYNTRWHSNWNGTDTERYITIKLDEARYVSSVEFVPAGGGNGKIIDGIIYGSVDGEEWVELAKKTNLTYSNQANTNEDAIKNTKDFAIEDPQKVQYIKIKATKASNGNWFTARAFNLYEDTTIIKAAEFSFDGKNAGKIWLLDEFKDKNFKYSIDGGNTWKSVSTDSHLLSDEELNKINSENGIKVKIDGDQTEYRIQIKKGNLPVINPYVNDLENRLIALTNVKTLEWKIDNGTWKSYEEKEPVVTGTRKLYVRTKATRTTTASDALEYQFTEDNQPTDMKYIPIKHLSIHEYSTQSIDATRPFYAPNAIDGNPNTLWHTDFRYSVLTQSVRPFITIKLDEAKYISALEFIQKKYREVDPDYIKNGIVYVSEDGKNWVEAGRIENCPKDNQLRQIKFNESVYGQYIKFEMETYDIFASVAMINLYEDTTKKSKDVSIEYSIMSKTNQDVVATLVADDIVVTNNNGLNTYTFTDNGSFVFEYTDNKGVSKTVTATVDWIDRVAPIGTIIYSTRDLTNEDVVVTLETNEPVTITNNGGKSTYTFTEKGQFTFEFHDEAGNEGEATAIVDWIDKDAPTASIVYSTTKPTNKEVVATLNVEDGVLVKNNGGSKKYTFTDNGSFTFEYVDGAGNSGSITAKVDWIDRIAPKGAITYSITTLTNQDVVATLIGNEKIIILNNDGKESRTFKMNGEFTFEFQDEAGNKASILAKVDNIDKIAPTANVTYSTTELTNKDVIVTLVEASEDITITNNDGKDSYVFTENGEFTFEFVDAAGNKGEVTAKVDNIDKEIPTAEIKYSTTSETDRSVVATLTNYSKDITILNNNGLNTYTFTENGEFTFEFVDKLGNKGEVTAKVTWISKTKDPFVVKFDNKDVTDKDVTVILELSEGVTITNNGGSNVYTFTENGEFTFEYIDKDGVAGTYVVKVDWIKRPSKTEEPVKPMEPEINENVVVNTNKNEHSNKQESNVSNIKDTNKEDKNTNQENENNDKEDKTTDKKEESNNKQKEEMKENKHQEKRNNNAYKYIFIIILIIVVAIII